MPTYRVKAYYLERKGPTTKKRTAVHALVTQSCEKEARLSVLTKHVQQGHRVVKIEAKPI